MLWKSDRSFKKRIDFTPYEPDFTVQWGIILYALNMYLYLVLISSAQSTWVLPDFLYRVIAYSN